MVFAALSTTARRWKWPKRLSTHEQIKTWKVHMMEYCRAVKRNKAICGNMRELRDYHTKWGNSEKDRYYITYVWHPENNANQLIYKRETDSQPYRTNLWLPRGKEEGNSGVRDSHTTACEQMQQDLLYRTGDEAWYPTVTYNGKESEKEVLYLYITCTFIFVNL